MSSARSSNPSIPSVIGSLDASFPSRPSAAHKGIRPVDVGAEQASATEQLRTAVNFIVALVALILLLPVLALIALAVRLSSPGPVFYTQERVGLDRRWRWPENTNHRRRVDMGGKPFTMYKFRTMVADAERQTGAVWAQPSDPRVTPLGRVLRQYRLDELPQLVNVLKGEMSVVGPRPEQPQIFARLRGEITEYPLRQRAKPGITGLAQISHNYDQSIDDVRTKVRYDLEYIRKQSVTEDLRIMAKTIPVMLFRRGGW
jgi:lipopolysaccharide/colanic/teichoic acid biosynthesis glycosyltransferase